MKRKIKIGVCIIIGLFGLFCLYRGIGYLVRAVSFPKITNITSNNEASFFGYYVLSGVWSGVFILVLIIDLIYFLKFVKTKKTIAK